MNLVSTIATAARTAERQHATLLSEAASLDGQASAAKAAADSKRKRARSLQSLMSRLKGTCDAIERTEPAILADLGIDLSADAPSISAPTSVDGEPAAVVEGADHPPADATADGSAEEGEAIHDRGDRDGAGAELDAILEQAPPATKMADTAGPDVAAAPEPPVRRVPRFEPKPAPEPVTGTVAERVLAVLKERRHGSTVAIDWDDLAKQAKAPLSSTRQAVDRLQQRAAIKKVKSAVAGQLSAIIRDVRAERAA